LLEDILLENTEKLEKLLKIVIEEELFQKIQNVQKEDLVEFVDMQKEEQ